MLVETVTNSMDFQMPDTISSGFGFDAVKFPSKKRHHLYAGMRNVISKNSEAAADLKQYAIELRL